MVVTEEGVVLKQVNGEGVFDGEIRLAGPAGVELSCGAGPVDQQVCDGGLSRSTVIEHHTANTDLFQYLYRRKRRS